MVWWSGPQGRVAKSLRVIYDQVSNAYPNRNTSSDGTIGDAAHAATNSDHNPGPDRVVTALDITHDPAHGVDTYALAENLLREKDGRIKYIISNRKIASGTGQSNPAWVWREYSGSNPHDMHIHISVKDPPVGDGEQPWKLDLTAVPPPILPGMPVLQRGSSGDAVKVLQTKLFVDGYFGPATEAAVKEFQTANRIVADGVVGPYTWRALLAGEPVEGDWIEDITATVFGGTAEVEKSAYDGHRITETEMCVALPDRFEAARPTVEVRNGSKIASATIEDVGPWMIDDPYWALGKRPVAEICFATRTPLPSGPNKGRVPTQDAGIDLSPALGRFLGIDGKGKVAWRLIK